MRIELFFLFAFLMAGNGVLGDFHEPESPLTNVEVVRMVMAGYSESEILERIRASAVDFELDPEVITELRKAGVSDKILTAMRERQAQAGAPLPQESSTGPQGNVEMTFASVNGTDESKKPPSFVMIRRVPGWAIRELGMRDSAEVQEMAFFLLCSTSHHVPDHWSQRTPLKEFRRHRVLGFRPKSHPDKVKGFEVLSLDLPPTYSLSVPAGTHSVIAGVAVEIGPRWHVIVSDDRRGVVVEEGKTTRLMVSLIGDIQGSRMTGFEMDQILTIREVDLPVNGTW